MATPTPSGSAGPSQTDTTTTTTTMAGPTPSASDVYDRQIRLWGAEAQKKMQQSRVLYIHITGTTSEVLKNLVLAGIAATLCDTRPAATTLDRNPCFFSPTNKSASSSSSSAASTSQPANKKLKHGDGSVGSAVQPLVEELNPLLGPCPVLTKTVQELTADDVSGFAVVIASQIPLADAIRLAHIVSHDQGHAFYLADCFGMFGAAMIDLGPDYRYRPEQGKKLLDPIGLTDYVPLPEMVKVPLSRATNRFHKQPPPTWIRYRCLLEYQAQTGLWLGDDAVDTDKAKVALRDYLKEQGVSLPDDDDGRLLDSLVTAGMAQITPVCSVLGGILGNEVIKIISGRGEPANNTLLMDGTAFKVWTFLVKEAAAK